jgi:hypothetical protein
VFEDVVAVEIVHRCRFSLEEGQEELDRHSSERRHGQTEEAQPTAVHVVPFNPERFRRD